MLSCVYNSCVHPVITIASIFSGEDNLFYGVLDHKFEIRENKKLYHPSSDHIAMAWIFKQWSSYNYKNPHLIPKFCKEMKLRQNRMEILSRKCNIIINHKFIYFLYLMSDVLIKLQLYHGIYFDMHKTNFYRDTRHICSTVNPMSFIEQNCRSQYK